MNIETDCQIANCRTGVTRYRLPPGATLDHRHAYDYVIIPITSGRLRINESGTESIADLSRGTTYFRAAGVEHDVGNAGAEDVVFVEVEILG
jgi:beta-alanine degradation protein BauB